MKYPLSRGLSNPLKVGLEREISEGTAVTPLTPPSIFGVLREGETIYYTPGTFDANPQPRYYYSTRLEPAGGGGFTEVQVSATNTFVMPGGYEGGKLRVRVFYDNGITANFHSTTVDIPLAETPPSSGLVTRFQSDVNVVSSGGVVSSWTDTSGTYTLTPDRPVEAPPLLRTTPSGLDAIEVAGGGMRMLGPITGLPSGASARTIAMCFRPGASGFFGGFGYGDGVTDHSFVLGLDSSALGLNYILDWFGGRITGPVSTQNWVVLAATYDGTTIELFVNSVSVGTIVKALDTGTAGINLGAPWGLSTSTDGLYADMAVWDDVLTPAELAAYESDCRAKYVIDTVPPQLTSAQITSTTSATLDWSVSTNKGEGTLYTDVKTTNTPIDAATMEAEGDPVSVSVPGVINGTYTGLTPATVYYVHFMHKDASGNTSSGVVTAGVSTQAADVTAPTLSSPTAAPNGTSSFTGAVTTDENNGTLSYVVSSFATTPTAVQIENGQNHTGVAATASGSLAITSAGTKNVSGTGLLANTDYYIHYAHRDAAGNISTAVSSASFTTAATSTTKPEGYDLIAGLELGDGNWAFVANIVAANYPVLTPNKTATPATITSVLASAVAGDIIELADGAYGTSLNALSGRSFGSEVTVYAENYGGATVSGLSLQSGTNNVSVIGVHGTSVTPVYTGTTNCKLMWGKFLSGGLEANTNLEVGYCLFDRGWPRWGGSPSANGFTGLGVDLDFNVGLNFHNNIVMRSSGDNVKFRGATDCLITQCLIYGQRTYIEDDNAYSAWQVINNPGDTSGAHPDGIQADSVPNTRCTISYTAVINPNYSASKGSQGAHLRGPMHVDCTLDNCMANSSLNSRCFDFRGTGWLVRNCSANDYNAIFGWSTNSATNRIENCVGGFPRYNDDQGVSNIVEVGCIGTGFGDAIAFAGPASQNHLVSDWEIASGYDSSKGASGLLALINTRRLDFEGGGEEETGTAPVNTVAPAVTGTAETGETLTCSTGTWTGNPAPTYAYQWQRDTGGGFSNIGGATASTYVLTAGDETYNVRCVVTATNASGSVAANSNSVLAQAPAGGGAPTVVSNVSVSGAVTSYNHTLPATASAGDEIVLFVVTGRIGGHAVASDGFTSLLNVDGPVSATTHSAVLRKTAVGGEDSVTITQNGQFFRAAVVACIVSGTSGVDTTGSLVETSVNTPAASVTTTAANCLLLTGWFERSAQANTIYPATFLSEADNADNGQIGVSYDVQAVAGASTPIALTVGSAARQAFTIAFAP